MHNLEKKAEYYLQYLDSKQRDDGEWFVYMKDNRPKQLHDAIYGAHGGKLPNDWIFGTFSDLLQKITEYNADTVDDLRDNGYDHEIIDSYVDIYTYDLLQWLASDIDNLEYMSRVMAEHVYSEDDGAWQALARMQYYAINDVMQHVLSLLEKDID